MKAPTLRVSLRLSRITLGDFVLRSTQATPALSAQSPVRLLRRSSRQQTSVAGGKLLPGEPRCLASDILL